MNKDQLKRQWRDYVGLVDPDKYQAADWWLSKLDAYQSSLLERIEGMKEKLKKSSFTGDVEEVKKILRNEIIDDIINLIKPND